MTHISAAQVVYSKARIISVVSNFISLSAVQNMSHFTYFLSCHFHHRVLLLCSPVGLISLMERALCPVFARVRVRFPAKPEVFQGFFSTAQFCLFNYEDHFHFRTLSSLRSRRRYFLGRKEKFSSRGLQKKLTGACYAGYTLPFLYNPFEQTDRTLRSADILFDRELKAVMNMKEKGNT